MTENEEKPKENPTPTPTLSEMGASLTKIRSFIAAGDEWLIKNYPKAAWGLKILTLLILIWCVWQLTLQDYRSRAICSYFYTVQPQIDECKQPLFVCADTDKNPWYKVFENLTNGSLNANISALPGVTPRP